MNKTVMIEGMMCGHCQKHVEEALKKLGLNANASFEEGKAWIRNTDIEDSVLVRAIEDAGYTVKEVIND